MKTPPVTHQATPETTRQVVLDAFTQSQDLAGLDEDCFRKALGTHRVRRLDAWLRRRNLPLVQAVSCLQYGPGAAVKVRMPLVFEELVQALSPELSRQSASEQAFFSALAAGLPPALFRNTLRRLPRSGRGTFVVCPDVSKSADAFARVEDVGYVFVHKCNNHDGGAQKMNHAELDRLALAATFPEGRYDGFVLRSPERVLSRIQQHFNCRRAVLVLLQDGHGRQSDLAAMRNLCAPGNLHPDLHVFAGSTDDFLASVDRVHAAMTPPAPVMGHAMKMGRAGRTM